MVDKNVAVYVLKNDVKVQVGWATPDTNGVRSIDIFEGAGNVALKEVFFSDSVVPEPVLDTSLSDDPTPFDPEVPQIVPPVEYPEEIPEVPINEEDEDFVEADEELPSDEEE